MIILPRLVPVHKRLFLLAEVGRIGAEGRGLEAIRAHLLLAMAYTSLRSAKVQWVIDRAISRGLGSGEGESQAGLRRAKIERL